MNFINEKDVLNFYLDLVKDEKITFLKDKPSESKEVTQLIVKLKDEQQLHNRIQIAKQLWKKLFEHALTHISSDKKGYDQLFSYFDTYVDFEELIFASDSFYRDHTLHCLWVYFLGEYLTYETKFNALLWRENAMYSFIESLKQFAKVKDVSEASCKAIEGLLNQYPDMCVLRCLSALTHDLGYPLKKIKKINTSIRKVLPYFGIERFSEFDFEYTTLHMPMVEKMVEWMSIETNAEIKFKKENDRNFDYHKYCEFIAINEDTYTAYDIKKDAYDIPNEDVKEDFKDLYVDTKMSISSAAILRYTSDFENYHHGIMSAYILFKHLNVFKNIDVELKENRLQNINAKSLRRLNTLNLLFKAIADHTSDGYRIENLEDSSSILAFVDEIEEFSRISRANQNRQFIEEFCKTSIDVVDNCLEVSFVFDNQDIDNLNPEMAFKSRCKRMLSLFNIPNLNAAFHMKIHCIGKLPQNQNHYTLEIKRKFAKISINDEAIHIPSYLKSNEFYTTEQYKNM